MNDDHHDAHQEAQLRAAVDAYNRGTTLKDAKRVVAETGEADEVYRPTYTITTVPPATIASSHDTAEQTSTTAAELNAPYSVTVVPHADFDPRAARSSSDPAAVAPTHHYKIVPETGGAEAGYVREAPQPSTTIAELNALVKLWRDRAVAHGYTDEYVERERVAERQRLLAAQIVKNRS